MNEELRGKEEVEERYTRDTLAGNNNFNLAPCLCVFLSHLKMRDEV